LRLDLAATGASSRAVHDAVCPEVAPTVCAEQEVPDHRHHQGVVLARLEPSISAGLGRGFHIGFQLPIDLRRAEIEYRLFDGSPYEPAYGDVHHRNEWLFGLGDARFVAGWTGEPPGTPVIVGGSLGIALPTGRTEEDPFAAAAVEEEHQHLQFGNGTVDPLASFRLIVRGETLGMFSSVSGRFPVYANKKGYQGPVELRGAVGPSLRPPEPLRSLQLLLLAVAGGNFPERWQGEPGQNSGLLSVGAHLGVIWNITPSFAIQGSLLANAFQQSRGGQFSRPLTLSLSVSGFLALRPKKAREHGH